MIKLNSQYSLDVGVLVSNFLNYITLKPGQATFMGSNEPHAYISGNCIEAMANSDNVVRAGLTPKYKDVATLTSMLTYKTGELEVFEGIVVRHQEDYFISSFKSYTNEFQCHEINIKNTNPDSCSMTSFIESQVAFLLIVINGQVKL